MSLPNEIIPVGLLGTGVAAAPAVRSEIERSLRFNSADSAYLSRTPESAGNRKTWTWAGWVKRTNIGGVYPRMFGTYTGGSYTGWDIEFSAADKIEIHYYDGSNYVFRRTTTAVYRDPSAWYHIVVAVDTTQSTPNDRLKLYVNGVQETVFDTTTNVSQNYETNINTLVEHRIGYNYTYSDFYLADVHFIDGSALTPTSFGEFDANGIWQPIEYSGTYPGNSFHLDFADNSTSAALGYDAAGSNDWTVNNISVYEGNVNWTSATSLTAGTFYPGRDVIANIYNGIVAANGSPFDQFLEFATFPATLTFNPAITSSSGNVKMWVGSYYGPASYTVTLNGSTSYNFTSVPAEPNPAVLYDLGVTTLSSITFPTGGATAMRIMGIVANGVLLSDYDFGQNNDSLVDSPTNVTGTDTGVGGEVTGNYATFNPIEKPLVRTPTFSNGNLDVVGESASGQYNGCMVSLGFNSDKWYCEFTWQNNISGFFGVGIIPQNELNALDDTTSNNYGLMASPNCRIYMGSNGAIYYNSGLRQSGLPTFSEGDVINLAVDFTDGKMWVGINGTYPNSGNPATGANATTTFTTTYAPWRIGINLNNNDTVVLNAGQRPFNNTAPSGFKALCTTNLEPPLVTKPSEYMDVLTYEGDGSSSERTITGLSLASAPDLIWVKNRSDANGTHLLWDAVRGGSLNLSSDDAGQEYPLSSWGYGAITGSVAGGIKVQKGSLANAYHVNENNDAYVAWTWDAGDSTVTNENGSITSQVRANPSAGFSIVTWSAAANNPNRIGHGLNAVPEFIIVKSRSNSNNWRVYTAVTGKDQYLGLNSTAAAVTYGNFWSTSEPDSSTFGVWNATGAANNDGDMVAYCFAPVEGYSAFGSYEGNGDANNGPFIWTGFRPKFLLLKNADVGISGYNWHINDAVRDPYNVSDSYLNADNSNAEASYDAIDFLSNGFKLKESGASYNGDGNTHVYMAFAENPFALNARAR